MFICKLILNLIFTVLKQVKMFHSRGSLYLKLWSFCFNTLNCFSTSLGLVYLSFVFQQSIVAVRNFQVLTLICSFTNSSDEKKLLCLVFVCNLVFTAFLKLQCYYNTNTTISKYIRKIHLSITILILCICLVLNS